MADFRKHIYWLDPARHGDALAEFRKDKKRVYKAKHTPCQALYPRREVALVEPGVWDLQCGRQGSWYRSSHRRGQSLVVTNQPLPEFEPWGYVTLEAFEPPRLATDQDVIEILSDARVPEILPQGWGLFSPWEVQSVNAYLASEGIDRSLQEIFSYYTANHLNLVFPRLFVEGDRGLPVPYSIQKTSLVCSACVEIFGILGEEFPVKYLALCPGLKYVKPAPSEYLRVTCGAL
jgi:hypothetical protein